MSEEKKKPAAPSPKKPAPAPERNTQEQEYAEACKMCDWTRWYVGYRNRAELYRQIAEKFRSLGQFKDSPTRAAECIAAAERAESEERDAAFRKIMEEVEGAKTPDDYLYAAGALQRMTDHPEAEAAERMCMEKYRRLRKRSGVLKIAVAALLCVVLFGGSALSKEPALQYGVGRLYMAVGNYEQALTWYGKAGGYGDSVEQMTECSYLRAGELFEEGSYAKAYQIYRKIGSYRGAEDRAEESYRRMLVNAKPGSTVSFGETEPDKAAKWYVLDNDGETVTLIAEFALTHAYDSAGEGRTWADSELRVWLNTEFLSNTFYKYERERLTQPILDSDGGAYGHEGGANTVDQVYILSAEEAEAYADILHEVNSDGKAKDKYSPTAYGWWLRTVGASEYGAAIVDQDGSIDYYGRNQASAETGVRPVVQVSIVP